MKKLFIILTMQFAVMSGFSQTQKGGWLLGGSLGYTTTTVKENGSSGSYQIFTLNPKIGYFIANNFALILNTDYTSSSSSGFSEHSFSIGPAVRYYFPGSESIRFFAGAGLDFASSSEAHGTAYKFEAGPSFFITPAVALEFNFNYQTGNSKSDSDANAKVDMSQFGVGFGFMIYLGKNKKS